MSEELLSGLPLPSKEGATSNVMWTFTWKPRPESGLDCLVCAKFVQHLSHLRPACPGTGLGASAVE